MNAQGRGCLFLINDPDRRVDETTLRYLRGLEKICDQIWLVCNREIQFAEEPSGGEYEERIQIASAEASRVTTDQIGLVREREISSAEELSGEARWERIRIDTDNSSRVAAFGQAMAQLGRENLSGEKALILTGDFMMGPVDSLEKMFRAMEEKDCDFWGIAASAWRKEMLSMERQYRESVPYLPLDFMVLGNSLLQGEQLWKAWEQVNSTENGAAGKMREECPLNGLPEAAGEMPEECRLTKLLEAAGHHWDVYIPTPEEGTLTDDYLLMNPVQAIRGGESPLFRKETFTHSWMDYLCASAGEQPWELYRYLQKETDYDTEQLLRNLIRTCHQDDIARSLRMTYVLPSDAEWAAAPRTLRVALVMHLYYMDLLLDSVHYAASMPEDADFYLVTGNGENAGKIREAFADFPQKMEIRVTENRGRDVGSLLVGTADIQEKYDLICFYHDKKTNHVWPHTAGQSFAYKISECVLSTPEYVRNVIGLFETKMELGMLTGTTPNHGEFLSQLGTEWSSNFEITRNLARELRFHVPMAEDHIPAIGLGDVFWYRTKAMAPLFRKKWSYEDFPEEPVGPDGTILHAIERLYPFAVQEAGYLPGKVMPDHMAALEIENLGFYVREYNLPRLEAQIYGDIRAVAAQERVRLDPQLYARAQAANFPTQLRLMLKRRVPKGLYRAVLKGKRAIFGPHGVTAEEEEATDSLLEDAR